MVDLVNKLGVSKSGPLHVTPIGRVGGFLNCLLSFPFGKCGSGWEYIYIYFGSVLFHDIVNLTSEKIWKIPLFSILSLNLLGQLFVWEFLYKSPIFSCLYDYETRKMSESSV